MRQKLPREEDILRAVSEAHWDGKRLDLDLFEGKNLSVSRLALASYPEICCIFRDTIKAPIVMAAKINVGSLQDIGRAHTPAKELTVEAAPSKKNAAHAEIPESVSRGLARKIVSSVTLSNLEFI